MKNIICRIIYTLILSYSGIVYGQKEITIRIDPSTARGGTASQIFESIDFIPLETNKESLFGTINQLEIADSLIFILDISSRSLYIFRKDGTFKIKIKSGGPDKFFGFFTVDHFDKKIIIANNFTDGVLVYDFNGGFIKKITTPDRVSSLFYMGDNNLLYFLRRKVAYTETSTIKYDLNFADDNAQVKKNLHPYNTKYENGEYNVENNPINFSGEPGSCMFSMPFDYTVYQVNDTGILCTYKFIFPAESSLPNNFTTDSIYKGKRAKFVYANPENKQKIRSIGTTFKMKNYFLFSAPNGRLNIGDDLNYMYNSVNGSLLSFSKVSGDSSSYYFPLLGSVFEKILYVKNDHIYSSIPSFRLFSIKENLGKEVNYPTALKKLLLSGSKDDNPVLVILQLRKNL